MIMRKAQSGNIMDHIVQSHSVQECLRWQGDFIFFRPHILNPFIVLAPPLPTLPFKHISQHLRWANPLPICQSQGTFSSSLCSIIALQMERKWTWWARLWSILPLFSYYVYTNHEATNWISKLPLGHAEASLIRQTEVCPEGSCRVCPAVVRACPWPQWSSNLPLTFTPKQPA